MQPTWIGTGWMQGDGMQGGGGGGAHPHPPPPKPRASEPIGPVSSTIALAIVANANMDIVVCG